MLLLASLVIAFLIAELGARIILPSQLGEKWPISKVQPDSLLGWHILPYDFHYTYTFPVKINSLGLRNEEIEEKKENEKRILVLGDSHVYGQGIKDENLFTTILETRLNKFNPEFTYNVLNAGVRAL